MTTIDPYARAQQGLGNLIDEIISDDPGDSIGEIGKPCTYHNSIDPDNRISNFFKKRMSVIDLIPCRYKTNFSAAEKEGKTIASGFLPEIDYSARDVYKKRCSHHGLPGITALRVYTTDDTTASDQFSNELKENYFQSGVNRASEMGNRMRSIVQSADERTVHDVMNMIKSKANLNTEKGELSGVKALAEAGVEVIGKGHRLSLPSIWSNSSYTPNFVTNIKLLSPYGSPHAIKEFVIKPLMYLLLIASPETEDGVSYGHPFFLTLKGYGMSYSPLAMISNVTLRRGGSDSIFNIHRQPLCIDVSLEFQYSVKGFAHHNENSTGDMGIFGNATTPEYLSEEPDSTALPTIGHILKSLQPKD